MAKHASSHIQHRSLKTRRQAILRALALGLPGIAAVVLLVAPPPGIPAIALAVNPTVLLCVAAFVGPFAAERLGLRSAILMSDTVSLRSLIRAFGLGAGLGLGLSGIDCVTASIWQGPASDLPALCEQASLGGFVLGLLYGGVTEELITRWGLLSILALGLSKMMPIQWSVGLAVILSAVVFALAHLPALWLAIPDPTIAVLIRTLALNTVAGLAFGAVFLSAGLEAAMLAHIAFHCAVFTSRFIIGPFI